jgi:hypothetical protein
MNQDVKLFASEVMRLIRASGDNPKNVYVGITDDLGRRLSEHKLRGTDEVATLDAGSLEAAKAVEDYFVNQVGTSGGSGGENENTRFVYAYIRQLHTNP